MAITNFNVKVEFDLNDAFIPEFVITDENDYTGDGDTLTGGSVTVYDTQGDLLYETEPGEELVPGDLVLDGLGIPTDTNGEIVKGLYRVVYQAYTTNRPSATTTGYTIDKSFDFEFCNPKVTITHTEDCFAARFDSRDTTSYAVDGESPANKLITHELNKPTELDLPALVNNSELQRITHPDFYEGTYVTVITTVLTYSYGNEWYINTTVTGTKSSDVVCDTDLCSVYCGVTELKNRMEAAKAPNRTLYLEYRDQLIQVAVLMILYEQAVKCGGNDVAETYLNEIMVIVGSDCKCDSCATCSSSPDSTNPKQINPFINSVIDNTETNQWYSVVGVPAPGLGNDNDFAFSNNGIAYHKEGGAWAEVVDLNGADGVDGTSSVWRFGTGIPAGGLGNDSDLYVDDATQDVYFKALGSWTGPIFNTKGADGTDGADGADSTVPGPVGPAGGSVPIGTICLYHGGDETQFAIDFIGGEGQGIWAGWLYCNGLNGTPDLLGRSVVGYDAAKTVQTINFPKADVIGYLAGVAEVVLDESELPIHDHSVSAAVNESTHSHGYTRNDNNWEGTVSGDSNGNMLPYAPSGGGTGVIGANTSFELTGITVDITESTVGVNDSHNNMSPYTVLPWIKRVS